MSSQLIQVFLANTPVHLEGEGGEAESDRKSLWKVVLRTGEWKLRPGPGGVKLNAPLRVYRDEAPKGHISLKALKANFDDGAKENVTIPVVHADGTTSDSGFVRQLVIQDVPGEDGSETKESLLWAKMDITDSEIRRKVDEKSLVGVSGGILFDYERTEDAKKYNQILSHVMVTNSPWINGTGGFTDQLPEGVMASEPADLPFGEVELDKPDPNPQPDLPTPAREEPAPAEKKTFLSYRSMMDKISTALSQQRKQIMSSVPVVSSCATDWPAYETQDVTLESESSGTAVVTSGYGSESESWTVPFKFDPNGEFEVEPFTQWTPMETKEPAPPPQVRPASRGHGSPGRLTPPAAALGDLGLQDAQAARVERMKLNDSPTRSGGTVGQLSDLLSRANLSEEDREVLLAEEARLARFEQNEAQRIERERQAEVVKYCGSPDGSVKGVLDQLGFSDPGTKKYVRNALLSDDGGPAIELSEITDSGHKTTGIPKTATDLLKGFIDSLPKADDGRVSLADQARRLPDDPKPAESNEAPPANPQADADALLAEMQSQGFGYELAPAKGA